MQHIPVRPDRSDDDARSLSEARYRTLVLAISHIVWTATPAGEFDGDQPGWAAYTGQLPDEYRGWGWIEAMHPDDRRRFRQIWRRAVQASHPFQTEHRLRRSDGTYRWVVARAAPVKNSEGRVREWVGAHDDVHETRLAAEERARLYDAERSARLAAELATRRLREAQEISDAVTAEQGFDEMLQTLMEGLRVALHADTASVLLLDEDASQLVVAASIGLDRDVDAAVRVPVGQGFAGRVAAERRPAVVRDVGEIDVRSEFIRERLSSLLGAPLLASGRLVGVIHVGAVALRDFGDDDVRLIQLVADRVASAVDRARLFEAERAARADAEAANRAKMEFLAMMSHELRTPLNAIAGYAELLEIGMRGPLNETQLADIQAIRRNERHLLTLVEQVLSFAKLDAGHLELDITDVRLRATVESVLALIGPQVEQRGLTVKFEESDASVRVDADGERLQQIILNLLSNAAKFTPEGGRITVRCEADERTATVRVGDTGIGIPADAYERIFEPFVQLEPRLTRKFTGSGLGLAISRELARAMHGELTVVSTFGRGSEFSLVLPRTTDGSRTAR